MISFISKILKGIRDFFVGTVLLYLVVALCIVFPPMILIILTFWGWDKLSETNNKEGD